VKLREAVGEALRRRRLAQGRTLREVATAAGVSLTYLSEVERGRKEASSEVLEAVCAALRLGLAELFFEVAETLAAAEQRRVRDLLDTVPNLGVVQVPLLADDVHDLSGLRRLGTHLFA